MLCQRTLYYATDNGNVKPMDLRKARCIVLQVYSENENIPKTNDKGPNILVDSTGGALYLRMWTARETKVICISCLCLSYSSSAKQSYYVFLLIDKWLISIHPVI